MSLRLEMLQVARLSAKALGESTALVQRFFLGQQAGEGGFKDRSGHADLYYTVFGLEGLLALAPSFPPEKTERMKEVFGRCQDWVREVSPLALDLVHLCCLARVRAGLKAFGLDPAAEQTAMILEALERFRTPDGGYHALPQGGRGTVYGCFLALGAIQDLGGDLAGAARMLGCLESCRAPGGAWGNDPGMAVGSTNATAAAVALLRQLGQPPRSETAEWLLGCCHPEGGFRAAPNAPVPDLLSTATALHALAGLEAPLEAVREKCLDFIDTLWTNEGGFYGYWSDETLDCEYTWYGLLALGHLSL